MKAINRKAFTLVELLVVIAIIAFWWVCSYQQCKLLAKQHAA